LEKLGNSRPLLTMPNRGENCRRYVTRRSPDCSTPENGHGKNIRQVPRFGLGIRLAAGRQGISNCANLEGTATSSSQVFERGLIDHVDRPFRALGAAAPGQSNDQMTFFLPAVILLGNRVQINE
jgi:hypothetical protein